MKNFVVVGACALTLAACGGGSVDADADGDGTVTSAEMSEAVAEAGSELKPEPGKYELTMELLKVEAPGAPEQMAQMMGSMMNRTDEFCLTPEMAEQGFAENFKENQNEGCKVDAFTLEGGNMDMKMSCSDEEGMGDMQIAMQGEVSPTASDMTMEMDGNIPQLGRIQMAMSYKQRRIGDCD